MDGNPFLKIQRLGRALMLPIAVLPVAGLLLRLGQPDVFNIKMIADAGGAIFDNLPLLFAIGVAVGFAKDNNGVAGLAGAIGYLVQIAVMKDINDKLNMSITSLLLQSLPVLAQGALLTIKFAVLSMIFGLIGGAVLALMGISHSRPLNWIARVYVSVMRGTPLLVQIFVIYYGLPSFGISLDPTPAGVIALSANVAAYLSESMT